MKFVIGDAKQFKQCIDAIVNLVDEGTFNVTPQGLHLRCMDPSQIAMVDFNLPKEGFLQLEAPDQTSVSLNLVDFLKILARARADEQLSMSLEEESSRFLLEFKSENSKRNVRIPLLDLGAALPREPKITFDSTIKMRAGTFKEMLKDAGMLSSHVVLSVEGETLTVEAKGDSGDLKIETAKNAPNIAELSSTTKSRAMYPFEYLDNITKACPEDTLIEINLKSDAPVRIAYGIGHSKIAYYLAPRVESA